MTWRRGGWLFGRDGTKPGPYGSWQNLNEGPTGEPAGPPTHGRAYVHPTGDESTTARVEWKLGLDAGLRLALNVDSGDGEVLLSLGLGVLALYLAVEARSIRGTLMHRLGLRRPYSGLGGPIFLGIRREVSVSLHDASLWWRAWSDPGEWCEGTSRWREGSLNFDHLLRGRDEVKHRELERNEVYVPMPEGRYKAMATLEEVRVERPRWPTEVSYAVTLALPDDAGIPVPGKGENSWDGGDDAILQSTVRTRSVAEAIGELVGSVLARRERHGARAWTPPMRPEPAPSAEAV